MSGRLFGGQVIVRNVRRPVPAYYVPIYVGRYTSYHPRHGADFSALGNPYPVTLAVSREAAVDLYRVWLKNRAADSAADVALIDLADRLKAGDDLALGCFCHPLACHADVIREELLALVGRPA